MGLALTELPEVGALRRLGCRCDARNTLMEAYAPPCYSSMAASLSKLSELLLDAWETLSRHLDAHGPGSGDRPRSVILLVI
jgi:hypothetical protein